jgi:DNA-binding transcriptional ArsR family regulator
MKDNEKIPEEVDLREKIEILSTEDDKIKTIGELLSNDSSRSILKILNDNIMTANQIAQKTGISLPLAMYHLKKMQELGIVSITTNENDAKYYTSAKFAFIITSARVSEKAKASKSLFNSLKKIYRFTAIGLGGLISWSILQNMQNQQEYSGMRVPVTTTGTSLTNAPVTVPAPTDIPMHAPSTLPPYMTPVEPQALFHEPLIIPLVIVIVGLIIEIIIRAHKR